MNTSVKHLIGAVFETIVKGIALFMIVTFVYRTAILAYDFGYRVFAEEPVSRSGGRTITVAVPEDYTVRGLAEMLKDKGLIKDADLFVAQELLSEYRGEVKPGIYDLSTVMTASEMLAVMSADNED
ncbi:MAG: endolytic transglycosylase MltG [Lachnospiraceae bacterium]|nr:endolytic transglycosylase MltG [Lachnospiraceae bacterium]